MTQDKIAAIEYVLFDMDGLMIDSESIYTIVTNKILGRYGKEMTWDIKAGCMGKPEREAAKHLLSFFPGIELDIETYLRERNVLQDELWPTVPLLPGVRKLVHHLKKHNIPMAIATGSRRRNYNLKTSHLQDVFGCFEGKVICADDKEYSMRGKPQPDIFIVAARELLKRDVGAPEGEPTEVEAHERAKALVIEDGLPGMQAGKRAGMKVLWIPDHNLLDVGYDGSEAADQTLKSLEDFAPEQWGLPPYGEEDCDGLKQDEHRTEIRESILAGRVEEAIELLNEHFPCVLSEPEPSSHGTKSKRGRVQDTPLASSHDYLFGTSIEPAHLLLNLHILAFVEGCRTRPLVRASKDSGPQRQPGDAAMESEPSEQPPLSLNGTGSRLVPDVALLKKGQNLFVRVNSLPPPGSSREIYTKEIHTLTGLSAFSVPEISPLSKYLSYERREAMADQIDRAILCRGDIP